MLVQAVEIAHENYVSGDWDPEVVAEWLGLHCFMVKTQQEILRHADKCKEFHDAMNDPLSTDVLKDALIAAKTARPELYSKWPIPASWDFGVSLDHHPDVPMHLLCLGIVKSVMQRVEKWLTRQRKGTAFSSRMKNTLDSIEKLCLAWCKMQPYRSGGKFGGWVSENYLSMT